MSSGGRGFNDNSGALPFGITTAANVGVQRAFRGAVFALGFPPFCTTAGLQIVFTNDVLGISLCRHCEAASLIIDAGPPIGFSFPQDLKTCRHCISGHIIVMAMPRISKLCVELQIVQTRIWCDG